MNNFINKFIKKNLLVGKNDRCKELYREYQ